MENKYFKANHQGPSWNHFKARDLHRKTLANSKNQNEKIISEKKEIKTSFSWIMDTVNPLNHLPIVSSIKNVITNSNKSLDIIQSAIGGFLFAGPLGILKGLGGWAVNKITNKFMAVNSDKLPRNIELESNLNKPNKQIKNNKLIDEQLSFNSDSHSLNNKDEKLISKNLLFTNSYINNYEILKKKNPFNHAEKNYSEIKVHKNQINTTA